MKIRPKSPEVIQSQVAAFASAEIGHPDAKEHVFSNLGALAAGDPTDIAYTTTSNEYLLNEAGDFIRTANGLAQIPKGTEQTAPTQERYIEYLRSAGGAKHEAIATRTALLEKFAQFEPEITRLLSELDNPEPHQNHPAYLGSGSRTSAYKITCDGKEYAVRIGEGSELGPTDIDYRSEVMVAVSGVPHLEQVVAISYEKAAMITELMPGKELGKDTPIEDMQQVTTKQLTDLVDTIIAANQRGIAIDPKPTNIFYDVKEGFGIIDLHHANSATEAGNTVGSVAISLSNSGFYGSDLLHAHTPETCQRDLDWYKVHLDILTKYKFIVMEKLENTSLQNALELIDRTIESSQKEIERLSDPDQVAVRIVKSRQWAERKPPTGSWTRV